MPKYSVIIPVYNSRQYLEECVRSVLSQTVGDLELLLIDDGSTDGSGALCDEIGKRDSRVRVFHKENGGAASARNLGIEQATGRFLLFVDGDDSIELNCLERIDPFIEDESTITVFGMHFDFWKDSKLVRTELYSVAFTGEYSIMDVSEDMGRLFEDNVLSSACNKVFPSKPLHEHMLRFPETMVLYEDLTFVLNSLSFFERIHIIGEGLYHYRNLLGKDHLRERVSCLDKMRNNLNPLNKAFIEFGNSTGKCEQCATTAANLYIMLLEQNLLHNRMDTSTMGKKLPAYIDEEGFRSAIRLGAKLDPEKLGLVERIEQGKYRSIWLEYEFKRAKRSLRGFAKRILAR